MVLDYDLLKNKTWQSGFKTVKNAAKKSLWKNCFGFTFKTMLRA